MHEISSFDHFPGIAKIPEKLFIRGELPPPEYKRLTVVGTRHPSDYGTRVVRKLITGLKNHPISIVSGLALGVDGLAHMTALENGIHTIAIPGSDISDHNLYPASNRNLAKEIVAAGGALLSPWDDQRAALWTFPVRNGIMAAISDLVLVIEAAEKSGTLITAREAIRRNIPLAAVPADIDASASAGTNMLIKNGAHCVTSTNDIINLLGLKNIKDSGTTEILQTSNDHPLLVHINEPLTRDQLIERSGFDTGELFSTLALLELEGKIAIDNRGIIHRI